MDLRSAADLHLDEWTELRFAMLRAAMEAQSAGTKKWFRHINVQHAFDSVRLGLIDVAVADGYAVLYSVDHPWWNRDYKMIGEMLVVRLGDTPGNVRTVLRILDALAAQHDADAICVGDALTFDSRLTRFYQRAGFRVESSQLIKECK